MGGGQVDFVELLSPMMEVGLPMSLPDHPQVGLCRLCRPPTEIAQVIPYFNVDLRVRSLR